MNHRHLSKLRQRTIQVGNDATNPSFKFPPVAILGVPSRVGQTTEQ